MTKEVMTPEEAWKATLSELELQMTKATFNQWLKDTTFIQCNDSTYIIGVRNAYAQDWLENRLVDTICRTLGAIVGQHIQVKFSIIDTPESPNGRVDTPLPAPSTEEDNQGSLAKWQSAPPSKKYVPESDVPSFNKPVEYRNIRKPTDPLKGHVALSHYAIRFWQPFIGREAFDLWLLISSYAYEFEVLQKKPPTLKKLAQKLGYASTVPLVGRKTNPPQYGLLNVLRDHRICDHKSVGKGRGQQQIFDHLTRIEHAPMLTLHQATQLDKATQKEHLSWLKLHTGVNLEEWQNDKTASKLESFPVAVEE